MVPFKNFSHVSLLVSDVDRAKVFYTGLLGLREIARPAFDFPGAWYSLGNDLALHLIQSDTWKSPRQFQERFEFLGPSRHAAEARFEAPAGAPANS
ncbi:MAG: VOC family protein [Candidatus Rokubacteria bacterium]|nr:VOC family protein [Candidatus Rokubacteria bacterium]